MRRWFFYSVAFSSLCLLAGLGSVLISRASNDKAEENPAASKLAKSKIERVTVYPNSALVTREVEVPDGAGLLELVVSPMPGQIVPSTMYSEGTDGIRILTTRFRTRQVLEDTSEERRKVEAEQEKLMVLAAKLESEIASIQKNMELLNKLEGVAEKPNKEMTGDAVITLSKYVMEQRVERAKELVAVLELKRQNKINLEFQARKMAEIGRGSGREERDAVIVVDREEGKGGKIRLNYLVGSVAWHPEYKLRAGKVNENVNVEYLANLMQNSGEDWNHVKLTLSTAQPMLNASPPELCMLAPVLVARGPMPTAGPVPAPFAYGSSNKAIMDKAEGFRKQAALSSQTGKAADQPAANMQWNLAADYEQQLELFKSRDEIHAALKKKVSPGTDPTRPDGPSVTYHLKNKLSIPSRNDEQIVEVAKLSLAPKFYYKTVPVLNCQVYRLADLVNKSEHILLPGEATMYQGTDFVGRMPIPLVAIGEEFTAGFGVDTQLQVSRQLIDQTRTTQGGNQVLKYEYRILISSYKSEPVKLQLWDRLPKGENESVTVSLIKTSADLSKDGVYQRESRPNNLLRWDLEVAPNCNGEKAVPIVYEFRMELDRQMAITGFQSR